ncbi:hypothetical protein ACSAZL_05995 [Methanosarcina sp. T3]|uniref:hypothetical protein n=1 Tax=Methanosarcina sp. T3 TaxID=3439062 RepID=UPI003F8430C3
MVKYLIVQFSARMRLSIYQYFERKGIAKEKEGPIRKNCQYFQKPPKCNLNLNYATGNLGIIETLILLI